MINEHLVQQVRKGEACIWHDGENRKGLVEVIDHIFPNDNCQVKGIFNYYSASKFDKYQWAGSHTLPSGMVAIPLKDFFVQEEKEINVGDQYSTASGIHTCIKITDGNEPYYPNTKIIWYKDDTEGGVSFWNPIEECTPVPKQEVDKVDGEGIEEVAAKKYPLMDENTLGYTLGLKQQHDISQLSKRLAFIDGYNYRINQPNKQ